MGDVFISYSHFDRPKIEALVARLRENKVDVWWDDHLQPGQRWDDEIEKALAGASTVVIVWSEASVKSEEVKDEAYFARDRGTALPVRIQPVEPPYRFLRIQGFDLIHDPVHEAPRVASLIEAILSRRPMTRRDEPGPAAATPKSAAPPGHMLITPALITAGLGVTIVGQIAFPQQTTWTMFVGSLLSGAALIHAIRTSMTRRG